MLTYQLHELFYTYEDSFSDDPKYTIDFVRANRQSLVSLLNFEDITDFKKYLAIIGRYVKGLVSTGKHNLAIDEAIAFLPGIERNRNRFEMEPIDDSWYLTILFQKACAHNQLKDYIVASKEFKALQTIDPQNDDIKKWLEYSQYGKFKRYETFIIIIASILIFSGLFFRRYFPPVIHFIADAIGVTLVVFCWIMNYKITKNKRIKSKGQQA